MHNKHKAKAQQPEFREHERGRINGTVQVLMPGRGILEARAMDIGAGGLRLVAPVNMPLDAMCNIRLTVPGGPGGSQIVMARAQVVSNLFSGKEDGFIVGLRFTSISASAQETIEQYLQDRPRFGASAGSARGAAQGVSLLVAD